ncbi:hypothetical protein VQ03_08980, partial [Methylobacterium tarhaniae]
MAGLLTCAAPRPAAAQGWPDREITLVVNYGAGGVTDVTIRALAAEATKILRVPIQVVNRAGWPGTTAPPFVSAQKPAGHTIRVTSFAPMAISPHLMAVSYKIDDFDYIAGGRRHLLAHAGARATTRTPMHR